MDVEREKKDKLAAARRKLNEYKLSRSGGAHSISSNAAPSQPADVPLFYQNINSAAASVNIFNPAVGNNNNNPSSSSSSAFSAPAFPTTFGIAPETSSAHEPLKQHNDIFGNQPVVSSNSVIQPENINFFNPFTPPVPENHSENIVGTASGVERFSNLDAPTSEHNSVPLLPVENTQTDHLPPAQGVDEFSDQTATVISQSITAVLNEEINLPVESTQSMVMTDMSSVFSPSTEFTPSAPVLDNSRTEESFKQSPVTTSFLNFGSENLSGFLPQALQSEISLSAPSDQQQQEHIDDNQSKEKESFGMSAPMFASSLFGTTVSSVQKVDDIFSLVGGLQNPLPIQDSQQETVANVDLNAPQPINEQQTNNLVNFDVNSKVSEEPSNTPDELAHSIQTDGGHVAEVENYTTTNQDIVAPEVADTHIPDESTIVFGTSEPTSEIPSTELSNPHFEVEQNIVQQSRDTSSSIEIQRMRSVQEALELQIEELRRENAYLLGRQTELTFRIEESEKLAHEFKLEKDRVREEAATTTQALRGRINSLCEENQRIVKNSTDIGVDLRAKLEEKSRQLEEMQKAVIIVSQSKMEFAGRLDHESERVKELQRLVEEKDESIASQSAEITDLKEKLKQDHQRDAIIHQLQDQARHYQVQCETLQKELGTLRNRQRQQASTCKNTDAHHQHSHDFSNSQTTSSSVNGEKSSVEPVIQDDGTDQAEASTAEDTNDKNSSATPCDGHDEHHNHEDCSGHEHHQDKESHHHHHHDDEQGHSHPHHHHEDGHSHPQHHHHHHEDGHSHSHHDHHHDHDHDDDEHHIVARSEPSVEVTELKKTLHRLEWENSSYRNEIDILAVDAKQKRTYEEKCTALAEENARLKKEVEQLEHVIIQLQGENDTIGDYITLYQTQKMALKECAKEKDAQLELLAREREMLLHRLAELTALVKDLKESKSEAGSQCADDHVHTFDSSIPSPPGKRQIEGKIRDLLSEISSSSLIENFHPCAVCSGRLMTV